MLFGFPILDSMYRGSLFTFVSSSILVPFSCVRVSLVRSLPSGGSQPAASRPSTHDLQPVQLPLSSPATRVIKFSVHFCTHLLLNHIPTLYPHRFRSVLVRSLSPFLASNFAVMDNSCNRSRRGSWCWKRCACFDINSIFDSRP